ncbi:MAG: hypothetical protein AAGI17_11450 [Planctomycetota bacterium]
MPIFRAQVRRTMGTQLSYYIAASDAATGTEALPRIVLGAYELESFDPVGLADVPKSARVHEVDEAFERPAENLDDVSLALRVIARSALIRSPIRTLVAAILIAWIVILVLNGLLALVFAVSSG